MTNIITIPNWLDLSPIAEQALEGMNLNDLVKEHTSNSRTLYHKITIKSVFLPISHISCHYLGIFFTHRKNSI